MKEIKYIGIDFDGTLVENDKDNWGTIKRLKLGAKDCIELLQDMGFVLVLNTCREGQSLLDAINYLADNNIYLQQYNNNPPELIEEWGNNCRKLGVDLFIDDKNIGGFEGWYEVRRKFEAREYILKKD